MKQLKDLNRCTRCHSKENLYVNSRRINKQGIERIAYMCRKCNTSRIKEYMKDPKNRETVYRAVYTSTRRHQDKQNARAKLNWHVRCGNIIRPKICTLCLKKKKVEGHHKDYTKPLEVIWTCRQCHADLHKSEIKL